MALQQNQYAITIPRKNTSRKKMTEEDYHRVAKEHDEKGDWDKSKGIPRTTKIKTTWVCSIHGKFEASYNHISRSRWCPKCSGNAKVTKKQYHQAAKEHDEKGDWDDSDGLPKNIKTKTIWICSIHGRFQASYDKIKHSFEWCKRCSRITEEQYHQAAKEHDEKGDWDDSEGLPRNVLTKTNWICSIHGKFQTTYNNVKHQFTWCSKCSRKAKVTEEQYHQAAKEHDEKGDWDDSEGLPQNNKTKTNWICSIHGKFQATYNSVKTRFTWCSKCAGKAKVTEEDYRRVAKSHDEKGDWDDSKGLPESTKISTTWICSMHGKFQSKYHNIKNKSWCPYCSSSRSEETCRKIFEIIFELKFMRKIKFDKIRPGWIKNPETDCSLELDGYNKDIQLAFEYQGKQHYEYVPYFHKTEKSFEQSRSRDELKRKILNEKGIHYIEIPYLVGDYRNIRGLVDYIFDQIQQLNLNI